MNRCGKKAFLAARHKNRVGVRRNFLKTKLKRPSLSKLAVPQLDALKKTKITVFANLRSKLRKGCRSDYISNGSFHEAIAPVLAMSQCFAVMPVNNIQSRSAADLYFSWWSFRTICSCSFIVIVILYNILVIKWSFSDEIEFDKIVPSMFYTLNTFARIFFVILARKWPALMMQWRRIEKKLPTYGSIVERSELSYRIKITCIIIMTLSLFEHLLNIISIVSHLNSCNKNIAHPIQLYFQVEQNQLFYYFEFSPYLAFAGKFVNVFAVFLWSYMDLFIIIISLGLSSGFKQINDDLLKHKGQKMPESYWIANRINYRNVCRLCETIDKAIGPITMVSFGNNLYFVCIQLLKSLNPMPSTAHAVYFWFSLIFLISRTLAVSLYSSTINDQSKVPIQIFRACPPESWCLEVKRFCDEVSTDTVALTGLKFFYLTRKLVLSVAGTIITYELVLIQFRKISDVPTDGC